MIEIRQLSLWKPALATLLVVAFMQPIQAVELSLQQQTQILSEANALYDQAGKLAAHDLAEGKLAFATAAQKYQTLVDSGVINGKLYFNLGNAYLQSGSLGRAIANYERAKSLMPANRAVLTNLGHARSLLPPSSSTPESSSLLDTLNRWNMAIPVSARSAIALGAWTLVWLAAVGRLLFAGNRLRYVSVVAFAVFLLCIASLACQWSQAPTVDRGVVIAQAMLHQGNGEAFPAKYEQPLREGDTLDILERRDGWLDIRTVDGHSGWISEKDVEVVPSSSL